MSTRGGVGVALALFIFVIVASPILIGLPF
jgi:hypothetical protein